MSRRLAYFTVTGGGSSTLGGRMSALGAAEPPAVRSACAGSARSTWQLAVPPQVGVGARSGSTLFVGSPERGTGRRLDRGRRRVTLLVLPFGLANRALGFGRAAVAVAKSAQVTGRCRFARTDASTACSAGLRAFSARSHPEQPATVGGGVHRRHPFDQRARAPLDQTVASSRPSAIRAAADCVRQTRRPSSVTLNPGGYADSDTSAAAPLALRFTALVAPPSVRSVTAKAAGPSRFAVRFAPCFMPPCMTHECQAEPALDASQQWPRTHTSRRA